MKMDPATEAAVQAALAAVLKDAQAAASAPDLDTAKAAISHIWFAVHDAHQALTEADNETRRAALARLGEYA